MSDSQDSSRGLTGSLTLREFVYGVMTDSRKGWLAVIAGHIFSFLAVVYGWASRSVCASYRRGIIKPVVLPRPVVSVGNITVGGVGKTPLIVWLARHLVARGFHPVILTRGYMAGVGNRTGSDEAALLRESLANVPVLVGRDRVAQARCALERYPVDVFLLDDGFQHWRVARDLDIVAVDALHPFGNGRLLPRGILREGFPALGRADLFVLTKTDLAVSALDDLRKTLALYSGAPVIETVHAPQDLLALGTGISVDLSFLAGKTVGALCGIGDPHGFAITLERLGCKVARRWIFPDHYSYSAEEIMRLAQECRQAGWVLVTTVKDAVKLQALNIHSAELAQSFALRICIQITKGEDELLRRVTHILHR